MILIGCTSPIEDEPQEVIKFSPTSWSKELTNPILIPGGTGQSISLWKGSILKLDSRYHIWYHATETSNASASQIFYAWSNDGLSWTKYLTSAVMSYGSAEDFDCKALQHPSVLFEEGIFKMWYTGVNCSEKKSQIGYAESSDGIIWEKYEGNPVLNTGQFGEFDSMQVRMPNVKRHDGILKMWYFGLNSKGSTGYATSTDGVLWQKYEGNPVLDVAAEGDFDALLVAPGDLVINEDGYHLFYSGQSDIQRSIGYAHSNNGISWTKFDEKPILTADSVAWEDIWFNIVDVEYTPQSGYTMWYSAGDRHVGRSFGVAYSDTIKTVSGE